MKSEQVVDQLKARMGAMTLKETSEDILRETGETASVSFLSNILNGRRKPSSTVLKYLGLKREETYQKG